MDNNQVEVESWEDFWSDHKSVLDIVSATHAGHGCYCGSADRQATNH